MPAVTVVIPAYNAERHIGEALRSVWEQTFKDVEVLLIDDGSTDSTVREGERFADRMDLDIVKQRNGGPAAARNAGIRRAHGQYCAFLDADDVMLPERLAAQIGVFEADPELGLAHTDLMTFDEKGTVHKSRWAFSEPCGGMVLDRLLLDNFITTSTVMAPRDRLLEVGLFGEDRRVSEDFELWLRMAARWRVGYIDRPMIRYRYRPGSLSGNKLMTALSALDVVETFWREHSEYGRAHPRLRRMSVARHLAAAGAGALHQRKRGAALAYILRSLAKDAGGGGTWKLLAKTLLPSFRHLSRTKARGAAEAM